MSKLIEEKTVSLDFFKKILHYGLLTGAILYIIIYFILVFYRIKYPFELEWEEGAMVDQVIRILSGQKLYVSPSLEFVTSIYTPLYFYLSAALSGILGTGFMPLRLISSVSSLGCFVVIFLFVRRETASGIPGVLAACLFAATFKITGAWFDVGRVDSLFLFFLLLSIYLIRFKTSIKAYVLAGIFMALSFLTKQTALVILLPIILYCFISMRHLALYFAGTTAAIIGISTLFLNYTHDGWYKYYLFDLPGQHPLVKSMIFGFWKVDMMSHLSVAAIMSLFYLIVRFFGPNKKDFLFYFLTTTGMVGAAWVSRLHAGGYVNVLLPAYAAISILFGLAFHSLFKCIKSVNESRQSLLKIFIYLICIFQFISLKYDPFKLVPSQEDLEAGRQFIETMAQMEGEIFVPEHGYLPSLAGKKTYAFGMAIRDILRGGASPVKRKLEKEISETLQKKKYSVIILDKFEYGWLRDVEKYYERKGTIFDSENVFWPVSGLRVKRPDLIYVPRTGEIGTTFKTPSSQDQIWKGGKESGKYRNNRK